MYKKFYGTTALASVMLSVLGIGSAYANPTDGVVTAGSAVITSTGPKLDIHQSTDKAVIDWRTFNIAPGETTQFYQPNSSSTTLNRVNASYGASQIFGNLTANGNIIIINGSGVLFGKGSHVDVNSLVATTSGITNADFISGKMNFTKGSNPNASVINDGTITAKQAGMVGLVAPNVENNGIINAKLGTVQLASGDSFTVDMYGDGLMDIKVSDDVKSQLVSNTGKINAEGGTIKLTAAAGGHIVTA